jgi:hypothetical protein
LQSTYGTAEAVPYKDFGVLTQTLQPLKLEASGAEARPSESVKREAQDHHQRFQSSVQTAELKLGPPKEKMRLEYADAYARRIPPQAPL